MRKELLHTVFSLIFSEMSGIEGEVGLVAGRSQREKRRSYKDLLREEEEIAAQVCKTSKRNSEVTSGRRRQEQYTLCWGLLCPVIQKKKAVTYTLQVQGLNSDSYWSVTQTLNHCTRRFVIENIFYSPINFVYCYNQDSELIVMGGDLHKKKKKHSGDELHYRGK